jgi:hypothetical protein
MFLKYHNNQAIAVDKVESPGLTILPPSSEDYPYPPYEFAHLKDINAYIDEARNTSLDLLYS